MKQSPTEEFYLLFDTIFEYYNAALFDGKLPKVMFVVTRKERTFGHYIPRKWINVNSIKTDEIAINPLMFGKYPIKEILQTTVHEMCHLWQEHYGEPSRTGYHNKEWGNKMESIGLMPSNTGLVGGKKTGQNMMDYIIENGPFDIKTNELLSKNVFTKLWYDVSMPYCKGLNLELDTFTEKENIFLNLAPVQQNLQSDVKFPSDDSTESSFVSLITTKPLNKNKYKYNCSTCKTNVWGKEGLILICGACGSNYK